LVTLTAHVLLGLMLFLLPTYFFFSYHDLVGVYWFVLSPWIATLVAIVGLMIRQVLGWSLFAAGVAGAALWILIVTTVQI